LHRSVSGARGRAPTPGQARGRSPRGAPALLSGEARSRETPAVSGREVAKEAGLATREPRGRAGPPAGPFGPGGGPVAALGRDSVAVRSVVCPAPIGGVVPQNC